MAKGNDKNEVVPFYKSPRKVLYAVGWFLIFALAAAELGLVSQQLHNNGQTDTNYPTKEYYHDLGLLLFTCIATFLLLILHYYAAFGITIAFTFILSVFWATGAGVLFRVTPFSSYTCGKGADHFSADWAAFYSECSKIVTIEGLAWAEWGLFMFMFFGMLIHTLDIRVRSVSFYGA